MSLLDDVEKLAGLKKKPLHELKWKIPEGRLTAPLEDAEKTVAKLKKLRLKFVGGGEYVDVVHVKEFGENVLAYFVFRTDKKTEEETILFDGYMLLEDDKLGMDVESSYQMMESVKKMGYNEAFVRDVVVWRFSYLSITINIYSVTEFGDFVEVCIPATKFEKLRETMDKQANGLFEKMGIKKEEIIPTDMLTLQLISSKEGGKQEN